MTAALPLFLSAGASADTYEVDTTSGTLGPNSTCALPEAVLTANGNSAYGECGPQNGFTFDTITFDPAVFAPGGAVEQIDLASSGELLLGTPMEIQGPGRGELTVTNLSSSGRIVNVVNSSVVATISGMNITSGNVAGTNSAQPVEGGGILNNGNLTLTDVRVADSTVTANTLTGNTNSAQVKGGGISSNHTLSLDRVVIENNSASAASNSTVDPGTSAEGGGLYSSVTPLFDRSTVAGNTAQANEAVAPSNSAVVTGAGARITSGPITRSTISGNHLVATSASGTATGFGGGLNGGTGLELSTVSGNTVQVTGANTQAGGGGVNAAAGLEIVSSTITDNGPTMSASMPAANIGGPATLTNTIVAYPRGATSTNCGVGATSNGFNLEDTGSSCGLSGELSGDPLLGPLQANGGPTLTRRPGPGSPVIDQGTDSEQNLNTDQRELSRFGNFSNIIDGDSGEDIGALEVQIGPPTFTGTTPASPSSSDTPQVRGAIPSAAEIAGNNPMVSLFTVPGCSSGGTGAASTPAVFASPGITVSPVAHNATTSFYGRVSTTYGTSLCSPTSISYTQADPPPGGTGTQSGSPPTGQRDVALKKCKRKPKAKRKKCRKRANTLPI